VSKWSSRIQALRRHEVYILPPPAVQHVACSRLDCIGGVEVGG